MNRKRPAKAGTPTSKDVAEESRGVDQKRPAKAGTPASKDVAEESRGVDQKRPAKAGTPTSKDVAEESRGVDQKQPAKAGTPASKDVAEESRGVDQKRPAKPGLQRRGPSRKNRGALTKNAHGPWRGNTRPDRRERRCGVAPHALRYQRGDPGCFGPKARRFAQPAPNPREASEDAASWFYVRAPVGRLPFFGSSVSGCRFRPPSHQARNASEGPRWRSRLVSHLLPSPCPRAVPRQGPRWRFALGIAPRNGRAHFSQAPNVVPRFRNAGASTKRFSTGLPLTSERHTNPNRKRGALAGACAWCRIPFLTRIMPKTVWC